MAFEARKSRFFPEFSDVVAFTFCIYNVNFKHSEKQWSGFVIICEMEICMYISNKSSVSN